MHQLTDGQASGWIPAIPQREDLVAMAVALCFLYRVVGRDRRPVSKSHTYIVTEDSSSDNREMFGKPLVDSANLHIYHASSIPLRVQLTKMARWPMDADDRLVHVVSFRFSESKKTGPSKIDKMKFPKIGR